jgi:hypothetical protein
LFDPVGPGTDRIDALLALAAQRDRDNPEAWITFALRRLGPAFRAADQGHTVTWDPPAALTSIGIRWTCTACGRAVLAREGEIENAYGSALTTLCAAEDEDASQ